MSPASKCFMLGLGQRLPADSWGDISGPQDSTFSSSGMCSTALHFLSWETQVTKNVYLNTKIDTFFFLFSGHIVLLKWHLYLAIDLDCAELFLVTGGFQNDCIFCNSADCCHFIHSLGFSYTVTYISVYLFSVTFCSTIHNLNSTCLSLSNHSETNSDSLLLSANVF